MKVNSKKRKAKYGIKKAAMSANFCSLSNCIKGIKNSIAANIFKMLKAIKAKPVLSEAILFI
ncbi:MAG: hypothetical protein Q7J19_03845 [Lutibacter sp.]|nr:hypothetical protein [Lutibacter sp.]